LPPRAKLRQIEWNQQFLPRAACRMLARNPLLGSKRTKITSLPVRFWVVTRFPSFIVVYRPETTPLQIISVLHAKRDLRRLIREREGI